MLDAFESGLEQAKANGHDLAPIASVASFFVSRVDAAIDPLLDKIGHARGRRPARQGGDRERAARLRALPGGRRRRPVEGPRRRRRAPAAPALGVDRRQGQGLPRHALRRRARRGRRGQHHARGHAQGGRGPRWRRPRHGHRHSRRAPRPSSPACATSGIDIDEVTEQLEVEGVEKFTTAWGELLSHRVRRPRGRRQAERVGRRQVSPAKVSAENNPLRDDRDRRLPRIAGPCGLVIFGVTGDLARKKLMPAVYDLTNRGLLPPGFALTGFARRDWATQDFAEIVHDSVREHARTPFREATWRQMSEGIRFVQGTFDDDDAFDRLRETVEELDVNRGHRRQPRVLPLGAAELVPRGVQAARPVRPVAAGRGHLAPRRHREAVRPRPGQRTRARTTSSRTCSTRTTSSGSTTTWARRRCRTCWRCASPTSCSSPSGTPTTSTTSRSPWPRTSASAVARRTTTASARRATSSRTT